MKTNCGLAGFRLFALGMIAGLIALAVTVASSLPAQAQSAGPASKVHLLFVWGTKATDTYWSTMISKEKIEESFNDEEKINLPKNSPRVGTWMVLEGDKAHPKEILSACQAISTKADANDAIFVYILCHGATATEDNDATGTRVHGLSPVCLNAQNLKFREIGIRRSSIMKAIQTKPHRLCVLVTDSCSVMAGPEPKTQFRPYMMPPARTLQQSLLAKFLLTERGVLNINSSDPNSGNMQQGELAMAWTPNIDGATGAAYIAEAARVPFAGTVFTNAFLSLAEQKVSPNASCSPEKFYEDLKIRVKDKYKETKKMVMETSSKGIEVFMSQPSQTVTRFAPDGTALPNK